MVFLLQVFQKVSMAPFVFSVLCGCGPLFEQIHPMVLNAKYGWILSDDSKDY